MPSPTPSASYAPATFRIRLILLKGVLRRMLLNLFARRYVRDSLARRLGSCARCGVCCHLVANKCSALRLDAHGGSSCALYTVYRLPNCRTFPIDPRDLADRNLVAPDVACGYHWDGNR